MNKSVKPLVCVLVVSDLMLATWILTQNNRYPYSAISSSIPPKKHQNSMFLVVRLYFAKYIRNTLLARKQTLKISFDTNGSPRHLFQTFIRILFAFLQA